jgi:hypothetical protein
VPKQTLGEYQNARIWSNVKKNRYIYDEVCGERGKDNNEKREWSKQ